MSSSKLIGSNLKRKQTVCEETHHTKKIIKQEKVDLRQLASKRKCAVSGCNGMSHLHTFPSTFSTVNHKISEDVQKIERVKQWMQFCDNEKVSSQPINLLHEHFYICSVHFTINDYTSNLKKRLKNCAVPSIKLQDDSEFTVGFNFVSRHLSKANQDFDDEQNCAVPSIKLHDDIESTVGCNSVSKHSSKANLHLDDVPRASFSSEAEKNTIYSDHSYSNQLSTFITKSTVLGNQDGDNVQVLNEHNYYRGSKNSKDANISVLPKSTNKVPTKLCCMRDCMSTNQTHSMYGFPKVMCETNGQKHVDCSQLERLKAWVLTCGVGQLLIMDPTDIYKKFFVCGDHFDDSSFVNRNRLKQNAIPNKNVSPIISNELLEEYNTNMKEWRGSSFDKTVFFTEKACALAFDDDMKNLKWNKCENCKEKILTSNPKKIGKQCVNKGQCWKYSSFNNMDPGEVPEELKGLTFIEEQVIARIHPLITVFKIKGHQYAYRGNVISFSQDVQDIATQLPHKVADLNCVVCIKFEQSSGKYHDFYIRQEKVRKALQWLKKNNPLYSNIIISEENLSSLPQNGYVNDDVLSVSLEKNAKSGNELEIDDSETEESYIQHSGVPLSLDVHQDEAIRKSLKWASMSVDPVKENNTPGFMPSAFPTLYPYGTADLHDARLQEVKTADYFHHLMNFHDGRFAQHPTFRFFAYNIWQRWTAMSDGSIFVRNNKEFQDMTVSQLKDLILEKPNIMKQIMYQASNLKGSKAYWNARSNELKDMVEQLGLPTIFLTLSCADGHWKALYNLLTTDDVDSLSSSDRRKLIQDNPHIVDSFFHYRIKSLIEKVLETHYQVIDYWYRIEYQHRGSPHMHGIFWIKDSPDVSNIEKETEDYIINVINYFSNLIQAWNPIINPEKSDNHPCRINYENVENFEEDLAQLLHMVQRHVCSDDYCQRVNKKTQTKECRFKFPKAMQEAASIIKTDNGIEFIPQRNDPLLNKFTAFLIQLWRANMDISPVISKQALLAYLTKYISKCEVQSKSLQDIFMTISDSLDGDMAAKKVIHKVFMKSCAERDISAQEVCHSLLRLKLHSAGGRQFVIINLSEKKWLQLQEEDDFESKKHGKNTVEKYIDRADRLENISLWNFAKNYNVSKSSYVQKENIVRVFPKLKLNLDNNLNEEYYKQQVLLHLPWRDESKIKPENEKWEHIFKNNRIDNIIKCVNIISDEKSDDESDEYESLEEDTDEETEEILEEFLSSHLGPKTKMPNINLGNREVDKSYNWTETFEKYKQYGTMTEFENYIDKMKAGESNESDNQPETPSVQLSNGQQEIIDLIKNGIQEIKTSQHGDDIVSIKKIIVQGKAGTGKSLMIKYITSMFHKELGKDSYILAAPTGVSAVLINGKTLHSVFKIPRKSNKFTSLKGERAREICNTMKNVKCLIFDEYSMIGCTTLAMINRRCKEALGSNDDFGGLMVILFGDIKQLPSVKDYAFFSKSQKSFLGKEGKVLINNFQKVYILKTCHRQAEDASFLDVLDKISDLKTSQSDYEILASRFRNIDNNKEEEIFKDALRLFATKDEVKQYNLKKLGELKDCTTNVPYPVMKILAKHNCSEAKKGSTDNAEGLEKELYLAKGCKIMLKSNIWLAHKLCNGTIGTVHDILISPDKETPSVILCNFPSYDGPCIIPESNLVPIKCSLKSWTTSNGVNCSRYQFPITLCYACSIHKSQGMTLNKAVIDIGLCDFSLGLTYVALSRVRALKDLLIEPFQYKRLIPSQRIKDILEMRNDFLNALAKKK